MNIEKEGIFIEESKNRFLCKVLVDGIECECYIPSSCRLENFLSLKDRRVLLSPTATKGARTSFAVMAIAHKRSYIVLSPAYANKFIYECLNKRFFSFLGKRSDAKKEFMVEGYKSDIFIPNSKTIIEIKAIICDSSDAVFPTVYSERTIKQLIKLKELLSNGYNVVYLFVSLNPYVKNVQLNESMEFYKYYIDCVSMGMISRFFSFDAKKNKLSLL